MSSIAPDAFRELVNITGDTPLPGTVVNGTAELMGLRIERPLRFVNIVFAGRLDVSHAVIGGSLIFLGCTFKRGIELSCANIAGVLQFDNCRFGTAGRSDANSVSLALDFAHIAGSVRLERCILDGALDAQGLTCRSLQMSGTRCADRRYMSKDGVAAALNLNGARIGGNLEFKPSSTPRHEVQAKIEDENCKIGGNLLAKGLELEGSIEASGLPAEAFSIDGFADFSNARIGGALLFETCDLGMAGSRNEPASLRLDYAKISAPITIERCDLASTFSAAGLQARGGLRLVGARIGRRSRPHPNTVSIDLCGSEISGNVTLEKRSTGVIGPDEPDLVGRLSADNISISGNFFASSGASTTKLVIVGAININAGSAAFVVFEGIQADSLNANQFSCSSIFRIKGCNFGTEERPGDLRFDGARIRGQFDIVSVEWAGAISFNGNAFGSFLCGRNVGEFVNCTALSAIDSSFSSYVLLPGLTIARRTELAPGAAQRFDGVAINGCRLGAGLAFWVPTTWDQDDDTKRFVAFTDECRSATVEGTLTVNDCTIVGDLDLTRLQVKSSSKSPRPDDGMIAIDRSTVSGAIRFSTPASFLNRRRVESEARNNARSVLKATASGKSWSGAFARSLRLVGTTADTVDLTGLTLIADNSNGGGDVDASRTIVRGDFKIYDEAAVDRRVSAAARIPGALLLEAAQIGRLTVSDHSFDKDDSDSPHKDGIVLDGSTIERLAVPRQDARKRNKGFPVPLSLADCTIKAFDFDPVGESTRRLSKPDETALSEDYLNLLDCDFAFHRSVYRDVYRQLRDEGHDVAARRIWVAEHHRAFWQARGKWRAGSGRLSQRVPLFEPLLERVRRLRSRLFETFMRYGVDATRIAGLIVIGMLLSFLFVAHDPRNFEATPEIRAVLAEEPLHTTAIVSVARGYRVCDDGVVLGPHPAAWGWAQSSWMTLRYHIPIVPLFAYSEFQPTNDEGMVLSMPFADKPTSCTGEARRAHGRWMPWTAETWFSLMWLANWILWPILLTFLIRKVLRD